MRSNTCRMTKKPVSLKPISWNLASKAVLLSEIDVQDEAIEKSAAEFKVRPADGDTAMILRKGEIARGDLKRQWPHHVALPAEKVREPINCEAIFCAAGLLPATPLTYSLGRDDSGFVVFYFAKPEDAEAFAGRFCGEAVADWQAALTCGRPAYIQVRNFSSRSRIGPIKGHRSSLKVAPKRGVGHTR